MSNGTTTGKSPKEYLRKMIHNVKSHSDSSYSINSAVESPQDEKQKFVPMADNLEKQMNEAGVITYDPLCIRKKSNWGKPSEIYRFDNLSFEPDTLLKDIPDYSPKLNVLLKKIDALDKADEKKHGKKFKHFIFSDLKSSAYGAKLIASALLAKGMNIAYEAEPLQKKRGTKQKEDEDEESDEEDGKKKKGAKKYKKIEFKTDEELEKTPENNFLLLSSVSVYDQNITVALKKTILAKFNQRPENIYGKLARIIVMDSGFKEGIDLFDIKYVHMFEPSVVPADQKQVIGRGTRTCGQKGLEFHPTRGWPLHVFVYDLTIPETLQQNFMGAKTAIDLYMKAMNIDVRLLHFAHDLEKTTVIGSVDYELNKNIHSFSIPTEDGKEHLPNDVEFIYGGKSDKKDKEEVDEAIRITSGLSVLEGGGPKRKLVLRSTEPVFEVNSGIERMNHEDMRRHIREHFGEFKWTDVKMENLCADIAKGGAGDIIKYTPTQDFVRHYFTPSNPCKGILLQHSVGTGKCHAKDTPILMFDGSIKMVQNIVEGELLMGDDSTPRKVLSLAQGQDEMYDVVPIKGDKYTVNSEHILCLKPTRLFIRKITNGSTFSYVANFINQKTGKVNCKTFRTEEEADTFLSEKQNDPNNILEIPIKEYMKLSKSSTRNLKGYRTGVHFKSKDVEFDPYIIGFWLGDGSKRDPVITTEDSKILQYLYQELPQYNLSLNYQSGYDYRVSSSIPKGENKLLKALQKYDLINNKHIPLDYKVNSRNVQLELLAGLIDSDGYRDNKGYDIIQKSKILAEDIVFMCRSLGFAAYLKECEKSCTYKGEKKTGTYYRINISGDDVINIPVKINRKKLEPRNQVKNVLVTGIQVNRIGKGDYYGFTLDGNNRYLLGDFTVTHNTCSAIAAATSTFEKEGYTILWVTRTTLKNDIWKNMFDQVCNESIATQIRNNALQIPDEQSKRMRLLSKAWRIRPMSYKQFSNLVSKQNAFYKTLVKMNGEVDPLRKTLLIIDEAHKLYGGGDLSSIERPDMNALHSALMNSYEVSGRDSVKLMLMTATPITLDPMELIKLINLCKPRTEQMETDFAKFSENYLDDKGEFTSTGRSTYLDDIAGYVSYLNREKDARQFSQPEVKQILVPMVPNMAMAEQFDKKLVKSYMDSEISELKNRIIENNKKISSDLTEVSPGEFGYLKDKCDEFDGKVRKDCEKMVKANIRELVKEAKGEIKRIREDIKEIRELIKNRTLFKKESLSKVSENIDQHEEEYQHYKGTLFPSLKQKCAVKVTDQSNFSKEVKEHPQIKEYDGEIEKYNEKIKHLHERIKQNMANYKARVTRLKQILKKDLSELERNVIKMNIDDEKKKYKLLTKSTKKDIMATTKDIKIAIKQTTKQRKVKYNKIRKTIKKAIKVEKKKEKTIDRAEKKLRKTLRKQGEYKEDIKDDLLKDIIKKYTDKIDEDLSTIEDRHEEAEQYKAAVKNEKLKEKAHARETAKAEKEKIKEARKTEKQREKIEKKEQKDRERATIKANKEKENTEKKAEKEAAKKTRKRVKP